MTRIAEFLGFCVGHLAWCTAALSLLGALVIGIVLIVDAILHD